MALPRLNGAIRALEQGQPAFAAWSPADIPTAQAANAAPYDAVVFEMEHRPFDGETLRDCLQYMLDRRQILQSGSPAPKVTPIVRIPPNGGEMNQWFAKQVLDLGAYGVLWPHVSTVEEAYNAVAACRYPRPPSKSDGPAGCRGDAPMAAAQYWGITLQEYYSRADVWPIDPNGEILVGIMCEDVDGMKNLPDILEQVKGIGFVVVGQGDLSQELGHPRQYDHPDVVAAVNEILSVCQSHNVVCGFPHVNSSNVESLLQRGFRWLMPAFPRTYGALELGRKAAGRT